MLFEMKTLLDLYVYFEEIEIYWINMNSFYDASQNLNNFFISPKKHWQ